MLAFSFWLTILCWPLIFLIDSVTKDYWCSFVTMHGWNRGWIYRQINIALLCGTGLFLLNLFIHVTLLLSIHQSVMQEHDTQAISAYLASFAWSSITVLYFLIGVAVACLNLLKAFQALWGDIHAAQEIILRQARENQTKDNG